MQHTFYAVFDDARAASEAAAEIPSGARMLRRGQPVAGAELHRGESDFRRGVIFGGAFGLVLGALAGALVATTIVGGAPFMAAMGGLLGLAYGAAMGGLSAANAPDAQLEKLSHRLRENQVLLTVEAPDLSLENQREEVVRRHGGRVQHRHIV